MNGRKSVTNLTNSIFFRLAWPIICHRLTFWYGMCMWTAVRRSLRFQLVSLDTIITNNKLGTYAFDVSHVCSDIDLHYSLLAVSVRPRCHCLHGGFWCLVCIVRYYNSWIETSEELAETDDSTDTTTTGTATGTTRSSGGKKSSLSRLDSTELNAPSRVGVL